MKIKCKELTEVVSKMSKTRQIGVIIHVLFSSRRDKSTSLQAGRFPFKTTTPKHRFNPRRDAIHRVSKRPHKTQIFQTTIQPFSGIDSSRLQNASTNTRNSPFKDAFHPLSIWQHYSQCISPSRSNPFGF